MLAIGTSVATVAFYLALNPGDNSALGIQIIQFNQLGVVQITAIIANTLTAILIAVLAVRERRRPTEIIQ
jgi:hypothetical protein